MTYKTADLSVYDLLKTNANSNRHNPTEAESVLWQYLRASQLGHKFLRQHVIGTYIVDFLCRSTGLVIEVDGGYHNIKEQQEQDVVRTEWLEEHGFKVIRFTNEQVLFDIDNVIETIKNNIQWKKEM